MTHDMQGLLPDGIGAGQLEGPDPGVYGVVGQAVAVEGHQVEAALHAPAGGVQLRHAVVLQETRFLREMLQSMVPPHRATPSHTKRVCRLPARSICRGSPTSATIPQVLHESQGRGEGRYIRKHTGDFTRVFASTPQSKALLVCLY